ncbi:MAG: acyl transferase [Flammeovirgaceae bacterium]|nr:acyl transferase [Flammeovirgaceae bacterium]
MNTFKSFEESLYQVNDNNFEEIAFRLFHFQAKNNAVYSQYLQYLNCKTELIDSLEQIPFLPIELFKSQKVKTGTWKPMTEFTSSGTGGMATSKHEVFDLSFYLRLSEQIFTSFYGRVTDYHLLALLPSYLERKDSSLIAMMDHLIKESKSEHSGFYLHNQEELVKKISSLNDSKRKVMLWGVSFALLDLAESYELDLKNFIVMETGGMKGRRKEWVREELHSFLCNRFNIKSIHSEYGMTELMSQAYSKGNGYYLCPPWMKVLVRDINDPFRTLIGKTGGIKVIDLANFHSCAFIETQDLGLVGQQGNFELLGRFDNSDLRGCNLLVG